MPDTPTHIEANPAAFEGLLRQPLLSRGDHATVATLVRTLHTFRGGAPVHAAMKGWRENHASIGSVETLQGWPWRKPRGYPGDYQVIDRIYDSLARR